AERCHYIAFPPISFRSVPSSFPGPGRFSLPARRSSDLADDRQARVEVRDEARRRLGREEPAVEDDAGERREPGRGVRREQPDERSEEHTSELQSRENLVCRLLLVKKNHINTIPLSFGSG